MKKIDSCIENLTEKELCSRLENGKCLLDGNNCWKCYDMEELKKEDVE